MAMDIEFTKNAIYMYYNELGDKTYISGIEIVEQSYESFKRLMLEEGVAEEEITEEDCIKHFCIAYWAVRYL